MFPAKALVYAIVVSLLIALVSSLLVSLSYLQRLQQIDQFAQERQWRNLQSGLALLQGMDVRNEGAQTIDLYGDELDQVMIGQYDWGMYTAAYVRSLRLSQTGVDTLDRALLLGIPATTISAEALYLADLNKPLGLAGNTEIRGTAYLPKAGVKRATVGGQGYLGTRLIYGQKKTSKVQLPALQKEKIQQLLAQAQLANAPSDLPAIKAQSFVDPTLIYQASSWWLDQYQLQGNLLLYAEDTIYVSANNRLEDLILLAPTIIIEAGFQGSLQAFALSELQVGERVYLQYPSVLGTIRLDSMERSPLLQVGAASKIEGLVFSYESRFFRQGSRVVLAADTWVHGQVYASGTLSLAGTVYGNVMCKQFFLRAGSGTYDNHLLGAKIDRSRLSTDFVGATSTVTTAHQKVAKWLK